MSVGGPSGIGGPKGPGGPSGVDGPDDAGEVGDVAEARDVADVGKAGATSGAADIDALSAQIATGQLTRQEAVDRLVEATATPDMDASERAELREMLTDLVANDPYLGGLANRI